MNKTIDKIKEDLDNLRDDAPVYPFWTVGDIKALITEAYKKGYIDGGINQITKEDK